MLKLKNLNNKIWIAFCAIAVAITLGIVLTPKAMALADSLSKGTSYEITCDTTAIRMSPTTQYSAFRFWVNSSTPVFVGGANVATTLTGMPYCTDTANCVLPTESIDANPREFWCVAGSAVTVKVIAGGK
jgi:hypothetical protein